MTTATPASTLHALADAIHALADAQNGHDPGIEKMLTADQARELLNVSRNTFMALINSGELPAIRVKSFWRIRPEDLRAYMTRRAQ